MRTDDRDLDPNDRTIRLGAAIGVHPDRIALLRERRVVIELTEAAAASIAGRLAFLSACNLAVRLGPYAPNIEIRVPEDLEPVVSGVYPLQATLSAQARWILANATSVEDFVRSDNAEKAEADVVIAVGEPSVAGRDVIRLGWGHWMGEVTSGNAPVARLATDHPLGGMIAGALAVARLHALQALAVGGTVVLPSGPLRLGGLSLSDQDSAPFADTLTGPPTLLIGAGALASSFVYALSHLPFLKASIDVLDDDVLRPSNANRQITAPFERARGSDVSKVADLATVWPALRPFPVTYEQFKVDEKRNAGDFRVAVTALDNIAARRDVAADLPRVLLDGATGGFMIALSRAADPASACLRCVYPEIISDDVTLWAQALGCDREFIGELRDGARAFDDEVIARIRRDGSYDLDEESERGLRSRGWDYLAHAACGRGKLRGVPSGSVSYVSALCGFLMAGQYIAELAGKPALEPPETRWEWDDVLALSPAQASRCAIDRVASCSERHARRSEIYRDSWGGNRP